MNVKTMYAALNSATRGEGVVYHTGLLMRDRQRNTDLNGGAAAAWHEYERGRAILVQRRVSPGVCDYIIVRIH